MKNLEEISVEIQHLARLIEADQKMLPTYGYSDGSGRPHIEVDDRGYHYVNAERGHEFDRLTTEEIDELLYAVFQSVTFELACKYELRHRVPDKDSRRLLFLQQIELISVLSLRWAVRRSEEQAKLLGLFPFDDSSRARAIFTKQLRDQGHSPEEACRIACERYPDAGSGRATVEYLRELQREARKANDANLLRRL
jgi:hypothetical protein